MEKLFDCILTFIFYVVLGVVLYLFFIFICWLDGDPTLYEYTDLDGNVGTSTHCVTSYGHLTCGNDDAIITVKEFHIKKDND